MEKQIIFAWAIMISCLAISSVYGQYYSETVNVDARTEKMTRLRFFMHDILSGENPTSFLISRPNTTERSSYLNLFAMNDPLTIGSELNSTTVGNAQGMYLLTSQDPTSFSMVFYADFEFTMGKFNGSSFSLFSRYPSTEFIRITDTVREVAIVGGRGAFQMARGFALLRYASVNTMTGDTILEFNVTLYHY